MVSYKGWVMITGFRLITADEAAAQIGESVKQHRIARRLTQKELAERTGVSNSTLKRIEAGGYGSLRDVMAIAIELNIEHDILNSLPPPPLQSLSDLDAAGRRIQRLRARAGRRTF